MMHRGRPVAIVAAVAAVAACGGDTGHVHVDDAADGTTHHDGDDSAAARFETLVDAWCPVFAGLWCDGAVRCSCLAIPGFPEPGQGCLDHAERGCRRDLARVGVAVAAGGLVVADAVPLGCEAVAAEAAAACVRLDSALFFASCPLAAAPSLRLPVAGEACAEDLCASGFRCSTDGICALPVPGGPCSGSIDCVMAEHCVGGTCVTRNFADAAKVCVGPEDCAGETQCYAAPRRTCQAPERDGVCSNDSGCPFDQFCTDGVCAGRPGLDARCGGGVACEAGLACAFGGGADDGTCQPYPGAGQRCALGTFGPFICAAGLACNFNVCGAIPVEGETCAVGDVRCAEGLGCHVVGTDSVCKPRVAGGSECQLDDSCSDGLFCNFRTNRCTTIYAPGATCRDGNECGDGGACVPDASGRFACVTRPQQGETCFLDDSCEMGLTCRSPFTAGACAPDMCTAWQL